MAPHFPYGRSSESAVWKMSIWKVTGGLALGLCLLSRLTRHLSALYPGSGGWRPGGAKEPPRPSLGATLGTFLGACQQPSHHRTWPLQGRPGGTPGQIQGGNLRCVSGPPRGILGEACRVLAGNARWARQHRPFPGCDGQAIILLKPQPRTAYRARGVAFKKENPKAFKTQGAAEWWPVGLVLGQTDTLWRGQTEPHDCRLS